MPKDPISVVNTSGFPLQLAVAQVVKDHSGPFGWKVYYTEHAWHHEQEDKSGYIDLVVGNQAATVFLIIECKRATDQSWVFLSNEANRQRSACKMFASLGKDVRVGSGWMDIQLSPRSPESQFCIVHGQSDRQMPMLERLSGSLVLSTESYAHQHRQQTWHSGNPVTAHFNVIVTTAQLHVVECDPNDISLVNGQVPGEANTYEAPYVRFRKQLSKPRSQASRKLTPARYAKARENTVLVVHAEFLHQFLTDVDLNLGDAMKDIHSIIPSQ